jgi:uncharacterized protein YkwD
MTVLPAALVLAALSCAGGAVSPAGGTEVESYGAGLDLKKIEMKAHDLINRERKKEGLSALGFNRALVRIARSHSRDMGERGYFSHDTPEGKAFSDRYSAGGFKCAIGVGNAIYGGAENISQQNVYAGYTESSEGWRKYDWQSEEVIAESAVRGWMESRGHRQNILTPHWETEGIGVFIAPDGRVYLTQNFC